MTSHPAVSWPASWSGRRLVAVLAGGLLAWSYLPLFAFYAREHWDVANLQGAYAHAPLVVAAICCFAWRQRAAVLQASAAGRVLPKGLLLLGVGAVARVYGDIQGYVVLQGMSLVPLLAGTLLLLRGEEAWRAMRFPVLLLLFVIPLPNAAIDAVTLPLVEATTSGVVPLLAFFDIEVVRTGHLLTVNAAGSDLHHEIVIAPECSGIRSLVALLAIGCILAHLQGRSSSRTVALLLLTPALTLIGNVVRVLVTIVLIVYVSPASAERFFHSASGIVLFLLVCTGLVAVDALLGNGRGRDAR